MPVGKLEELNIGTKTDIYKRIQKLCSRAICLSFKKFKGTWILFFSLVKSLKQATYLRKTQYYSYITDCSANSLPLQLETMAIFSEP